ncbi:MAG: lytic transglycosylase domain-containing protein, partial [Pseudomonadota bacterium]
MLRTFLLATIIAVFSGPVSAATGPTAPSLKPDRPYASSVVSTQDAALLHEAMSAADARDWRRVAFLQGQARSAIVRDLILWRRASAGAPDMTFEDMSMALRTLSNWPRTSQMQVRAEALIGDSRLSPNARLAWFATNPPISGPGKFSMARALRSAGQEGAAIETARDAWHNHSLDRSSSATLNEEFGDEFSQEDYRARVDFLLWTRQRSAANRLRSYLTSDWRALVDARIKLQASASGVDAAIRAVPEDLQQHPGLLFDRAQWRRKRGLRSEATSLLVDIDGADVPGAGRGRLWDERNLAMRRELKEEDFVTAYALAAPHGLSQGVDFAEAEWSAGWIALRMRDDYEGALGHFQSLSEGVSTPISLARADYWEGRALDALGDPEAAQTAYGEAAQHDFTYYGQLSAERITNVEIDFAAAPAPTQADRDAFDANPLVQALRLLAEAGESGLFRSFAYHIDDQLTTEAGFILLKELGDEYHYSDVGVRGAKAGLSRGIVATEAAYPLVDYPLLREPQVERSLMLALSRQESEMNPRAISHANARGLMQFLPATARNEARLRGLPYRTSWLTDDPGYNMTLGGSHLDTLLARFNGSYIMAIASYNAGPHRPPAWVDDYGDPRRGEIDPVDWVEFIPFSETRNYVQRVL